MPELISAPDGLDPAPERKCALDEEREYVVLQSLGVFYREEPGWYSPLSGKHYETGSEVAEMCNNALAKKKKKK